MKRFLPIFSLALITLSTTASAFYMPAEFRVLPERIDARVCNTTPMPMICSGQIFGIVQSGRWLNAWVNRGIVYPGQCIYSHIAAIDPFYDPMVSAQSNIDCQYYRPFPY